uniref:Innexin n=1 Tax=Haemonchus contortus TaxID=6289 RepID=A0A7I4XVE5_HAECO
MFLNIPLLDDIFKGRKNNRKQPLEDYVDRLHYYVTVYVLCIFALLVGAKQHFGNPIDCFISADYDKVRTWQAYILDYCFMQGTYRYELGMNRTTPYLNGRDSSNTNYISIKYYQWVPFFFAFQLLCFMVPDFFWVYIQSYLYIDMSMVVTECSELNAEKRSSNRSSKLSNIADYIFSYFYYRKIARRGVISSVFRMPAVATVFYGITKFLYLMNAILQLYLTTYFLGFPDMRWGLRMMLAFLTKKAFPRMIGGVRIPHHGGMAQFPYFPLEVFCNYTRMVENNNVHTSSTQCMIPLNYINEKLFLFLWFWIMLLIMITMVNIVMFVGSIMNKSQREDTILTYLREKDDELLLNDKHGLASKFVHGFMGADGVLLTRFMTNKAGSLACRDVVQRVWTKYAHERGAAMKVDSDDEWSVPFSETCYSGSYNVDCRSTRASSLSLHTA